ncbi:MAG: trimethylamine methyltransferase family protein, partial [Thermoplasmata archaeon]|nr:trimethylamine methyltransferase family protein [Thermoplasmata archaeon]
IQEGVPHMVNQALVPSDLGSGFGGIDEAAGASFEQLVVDAWIWDIAKEIIREFETDDAAIAFDTIREASADMSFLSKKHTMARFRKEFLATAKPQAVLTGREDFGERGAVLRDAQKEVVNILGKEPVQAVPKDVAREMDEYIEDMKSK